MRRWLTIFKRLAHTVIGYMVVAFVAVLTVSVAANAQSPEQQTIAQALSRYAELGIVGLITGAISYGAIKQRLDEHDRKFSEHERQIAATRDLAGKAHDRLYEIARGPKL